MCFFTFKENEDFMMVFGQTNLNNGPIPIIKRMF